MLAYLSEPAKMLSCWPYLRAIHDDQRRQALEAWADARLFGRDLREERFTLGTSRGLGNPRLALVADLAQIDAPAWLPADAQVRLAGSSPGEFSAVWIGSPRLRGLVVVRDDWDSATHPFYLPEDSLEQRTGRVGLSCVTD